MREAFPVQACCHKAYCARGQVEAEDAEVWCRGEQRMRYSSVRLRRRDPDVALRARLGVGVEEALGVGKAALVTILDVVALEDDLGGGGVNELRDAAEEARVMARRSSSERS